MNFNVPKKLVVTVPVPFGCGGKTVKHMPLPWMSYHAEFGSPIGQTTRCDCDHK